MAPAEDGLEASRPRPHSEIAALQDLFNIPGGSTVSKWVEIISRTLKSKLKDLTGQTREPIQEFQVVLFNSAHPPCPQGQVGRRLRDAGMAERLCCDEFLRQVADGVNAEFEGLFAIIVASPKDTNIYGRQGRSKALGALARNDDMAALRSRRRHRRQYCEPGHDLEAELIKATCDLLYFILFDL